MLQRMHWDDRRHGISTRIVQLLWGRLQHGRIPLDARMPAAIVLLRIVERDLGVMQQRSCLRGRTQTAAGVSQTSTSGIAWDH